MITRFFFLAFLFCLHASCHSQALDEISKIEFTTLTRASHQTIDITKDRIENKRKTLEDTVEHVMVRNIELNAWKTLSKKLNSTKISEIALLKSPTKYRAFDGARHSSIIITTRNGESYIHTFDDNNPNERLKPLMRCIEDMAGLKF